MNRRPLEHQPDLQCGLLRVDVTADTVTLYLPAEECADMAGAIRLARRINRRARVVFTISGSTPDTAYAYADERRQWRAIPAPRTRQPYPRKASTDADRSARPTPPRRPKDT